MPSPRAPLFILALLTVAVLSGCTGRSPVYVESDNAYTQADGGALLDRADASAAIGKPVSEALGLRHRALVGLRRQGAGAAAAADVITEVFPPDTRAVPVRVERARFNGQKALLVVELIGRPQRKLDDKRLWAISSTGSILYSATKSATK